MIQTRFIIENCPNCGQNDFELSMLPGSRTLLSIKCKCGIQLCKTIGSSIVLEDVWNKLVMKQEEKDDFA